MTQCLSLCFLGDSHFKYFSKLREDFQTDACTCETLTLVLMGEHVRRGGGGRRRSGRARGRHPVEGL